MHQFLLLRKIGILFILSALFSLRGFAQTHFSPTPVYTKAPSSYSLFFSNEEIEYENKDSGDDYEVTRKVLGATYSSQIKPDYQFIGQVTFAPSIDYPNDADGNGYSFGGGIRGLIDRTSSGLIFFSAFLSYLKEDIELKAGDTKFDFDVEIMELALQATYSTKLAQKVWGYGTLELLPMVDGEISSSPGGKSDVERDDIIKLKLGANIYTGSLAIRPELAFIGGQTFTIAVSQPL